MEDKKNSLAVPGAIVIAGMLIAGAVYFSNIKNVQNQNNDQNVPTAENTTIRTGDVTLNPVSTKDYIRGKPDAKVVIVEYSDTECPYCKQFHSTMKNLVEKLAKDGTIAWVYRNFPIKELHPKAPKEAEALLCAGKIGGNTMFWDYTDRLYSITPSNNKLEFSQLSAVAQDLGIDTTKFNACLSSSEMEPLVKIDYEDGVKAGGTGTPFSVFVASKEFNKKEVEEFLIQTVIKYRFPADLFTISKDNKRVAVSGAMPQDFLEQLVAIMSK